jgi:hypothetical protein
MTKRSMEERLEALECAFLNLARNVNSEGVVSDYLMADYMRLIGPDGEKE